jgi:uncharacterized membrane protein HdeD (DUF308 family)
MPNTFLKTIKNSIKYWYLHLISGILFIGAGVYAFASPVASYLALAILFSITFLLSGVSEIVFSISNRNEIDNWGWNLTLGIFTFIVGLVLYARPQISMATLPFFVGFLILFRSMLGISFSLDLKNYGAPNWGYLLFVSIFGVILSAIMIWNPLFGGLTIVIWTAIILITSGVVSVYLAFKLKQIKDSHAELPQELKERFESVQKEMMEELKKGND